VAVHTDVDVFAPEDTKTVLAPWTVSTEIQNVLSSTRATDPGVPTGAKYVTVRRFDAIRTDCTIDKMCASGTINLAASLSETVILAAFLRQCKSRKARLTRSHEVGAFTAKVFACDV
jgi:hypothetical protein